MENNHLNRVEKILSSLDNLQKVNAPDFFYTRLTGRMQNEAAIKTKPFFLLRPAFITTLLFVVLIINIISLTRLDKKPVQKQIVKTNKPATIESFAEAYNMQTASLYEQN